MRRLFLTLLALIAILVGAALLAPGLLPSETYKPRLEQALSERLGRDVVIGGDVTIRIIPSLQAAVGDVRIANAEGFGDEAFAEMETLQLRLALLPLLSRNVVVEEFVLVEPVIRLAATDRANNWTFTPATSDGEASPAPPAGTGRRPGALPFEAEFGDVRLERGVVEYRSPAGDWIIRDADFTVDMNRLDGPAALRGDFTVNGESVQMQLRAGSLRDVFEGGETPLSLQIDGRAVQLDFDGVIPEGAEFAIAGTAEIDLDLPRVARLAGAGLPEGDVFRRFTGSGQLSADASRASLSGARIRFDDIQATGSLSANYAGARPRITGSVSTNALDLTPYIPAEDASNTGGGSGGGLGPWSEEPFELDALRSVDAQIGVEVGQLTARDIELSDVRLDITLDRGLATADIERFRLYGGEGVANARIDLRSNTPQLTLRGQLEALQAQPFLDAAAQFDRLQGVSGLNFQFDARGASPAAIMASLNGEGRFAVENGALVGVNLAQVIRTVERAIQDRRLPSGFGEQEATDFSTLSGSFSVQNGLARNLDLTMLSPLLRVVGQGEVNLAEQTITYRLTPRAVQSLAGQGGDLDLAGIAVPIRISGSFNDLSVGLDFEAIAQSLLRAQAANAIGGDVGRALGESENLEDAARGAVGALIRDAIGGQRDEAEPAEGEADQPEEPRDPGPALLEGLINQALGGDQEPEEPEETPPGNR
ncbi:MAG: AsmA family protein [Pseudomonadota bacterium]